MLYYTGNLREGISRDKPLEKTLYEWYYESTDEDDEDTELVTRH